MLIERGNNPSFVYEQKNYSEKSAYGDCKNREVIKAMMAADKVYQQNQASKPDDKKFWEDLAERTHKKTAEKIIDRYKALVKDPLPESIVAASFDPAKPLSDQITKISEHGIDMDGFWDKNVQFAPLKVGEYCLSLVLNNSSRIGSGLRDDDTYIAIRNSYTFRIFDWSHKHELIQNIDADDMDEILKYLLKGI